MLSGESAYTRNYDLDGNSLKNGDVWLNQDAGEAWDSTDKGSIGYTSVLHEIGHALGLDHSNSWPSVDNQQFTVMSYNLMLGMDPVGDDNEIMPFGLQLLDIAAIQEIYGRNYGTRSGDTTYSADTAFVSNRPNDGFIYTIWDGAGVDAVNASGYTHHALIDLRQGSFSSIGNAADTSFDAGTVNGFTYEVGQAKDNVAVAYFAIIENAIGTSANDTIVGNAWNNVLAGGVSWSRKIGQGIKVYSAG